MQNAGLELRGNNTDGITVFPDIVVHRRCTEENLLVIEIKKTTRDKVSKQYDKLKLEGFRKDLKYRFTVFLELRTNSANPGTESIYWNDWQTEQ